MNTPNITEIPNPQNRLPMLPQPSMTIETITPELATEWLGHNTRNRPKKQAKIEQYTRDMTDGRWRLTGEAIKFGADGRLLDGQNRLHAVIKADTPIQSVVVRGLHPLTQDVMDSGAARQASDALSMSGVRDSKRVAAAARIAMAIADKTNLRTARYTNSEVQNWVLDHLDITDAAAVLGRDARLLPLPPSVALYCAWRLAGVDEDAAIDFFCQFATGIGAYVGSPMVALRRRLTGEYGAARRVTTEEQIGSVFRAWNMWRKGKTMDKIAVTNPRYSERIPEPI